ncbi:HNH endonuclease [Saccharothrix algeriensis]|uniref:HNH endonuclease n=1 Tax=Saccharothrix algeriensis TaxID=173560 RepID=A0A8T8HY59_9PSEU|nr:HNH endonuclease [Saccharothrix algeriensis]
MRALAVLIAALLSGCAALPGATAPTTGGAAGRVPAGPSDAATARARLGGLTVAEPGTLDGYARDCDDGAACVFGRPWSDVDGDGCDQRSQVLARDLGDVVRKEGRCAVTDGTLDDPYTGGTVSDVAKVQIDHVVPLAEMWRSGAAGWAPERRTAAANDLRNLLAVQGKANQAKGDRTPDEWMPPNAGYSCEYARIYVGVKAEYGLTVTAAERVALENALATCG